MTDISDFGLRHFDSAPKSWWMVGTTSSRDADRRDAASTMCMNNLKLWNFHQLADEKGSKIFQEWHVSRNKQLFVSNSHSNTLLAEKVEQRNLPIFNANKFQADGRDSFGWQHLTWQRRCCPLVVFFFGLLQAFRVQFLLR